MYTQKASNGKRIGAWLLDSVMLSLIGTVSTFISPGLGILVGVLGAFLYFGICEGSGLHGSLGKRMCGLMVVDERGYPLTYNKSFVRSLCRILSGLTLGIGFLIGLFNENGKTLHDQLAHTSVVERQPAYAARQPVGQYTPEMNYGGPAAPPIWPAAPNPRGTCPMVMCVSGPLAGKTFPVGGQGVDIGRDAGSCAAAFPQGSKGVSKRHCRVQFDPRRQAFVLYDLGSTYGTMLSNGMRISQGVPETLVPGDEFWLAAPENRFRVIL